jgi:serine/threonine-protein kinase
MNPLDESSVVPGQVLAGKYQVERVLGQGGMGVVVAAHHVQLDTKVAIKFLLPEMLNNREVVARFAREARAAVKITSEHVARVLDVGTLESGAPYMVMEFLEGGDLAAWLNQRGPLPIDQAVEFVLQACVAVAEAHGLGIVHRDLKPANLFCIRRPDGQLSIKVLDFGISKLTSGAGGTDPSGLSVTKTSAVMGSPLYMSPEQMQSAKSADAQSDIWALGVILYELLAGRVPFEGEAATEVAVNVVMRPPPPLRSSRPDVPPALEAVVLKCLEKGRENRYRNVAELATALAPFAPARAAASVERIAGTIHAAGLSGKPATSPSTPPLRGTIVSVPTSPALTNTAGAATAAPRRTGAVVAVAVACILVVGVAGLVVARKIGHTQTPAASIETAPIGIAVPVVPPSAAQSTGAVVLAPSTESTASPAPTHPEASAPGVATAPAAWSRPTAHPGGAPAAASQAQTQTQALPPGCDPPYTLDDEGRKHFKPECFLKK